MHAAGGCAGVGAFEPTALKQQTCPRHSTVPALLPFEQPGEPCCCWRQLHALDHIILTQVLADCGV